MNPYDTSGTSLNENAQQHAEIKEWSFGIRCILVVLHILPLFLKLCKLGFT